jgi:hypothetical protein
VGAGPKSTSSWPPRYSRSAGSPFHLPLSDTLKPPLSTPPQCDVQLHRAILNLDVAVARKTDEVARVVLGCGHVDQHRLSCRHLGDIQLGSGQKILGEGGG